MSVKRRVGKAVLAPLVAAGASLAARYVAKKGPSFVEETVFPKLREAARGAGGVAENLPDKARSAVSSGGDLAERMTERAREATGRGGEASDDADAGGEGLSQDELARRTEERAKRRAERRKTTKRK